MTRKAAIIPLIPYGRLTPREKIFEAEVKHMRKRARDALYKYGMHHDNCPARLLLDIKDRCTCGLYTAINSFHE